MGWIARYHAMANRSAYMHGVPRLLILRLLESGEMYGYELAQKLRAATGGAIALGEGVVYPTLHELESSGLLRSRTTKANGRPRVYYRLTARGKRALQHDAQGWWTTARAVAGVADWGRAWRFTGIASNDL